MAWRLDEMPKRINEKQRFVNESGYNVNEMAYFVHTCDRFMNDERCFVPCLSEIMDEMRLTTDEMRLFVFCLQPFVHGFAPKWNERSGFVSRTCQSMDEMSRFVL